MKIDYDKKGRKIYKFSHSVHQGGFFYSHKIAEGRIENKEGLKNALNSIAKKHNLIDPSIKIYDSIFFFFFMMKPLIKPNDIIESIHKNISYFGQWDSEYLYNTVYDLQEKHLREDLKKWGFDYEKG